MVGINITIIVVSATLVGKSAIMIFTKNYKTGVNIATVGISITIIPCKWHFSGEKHHYDIR